MWILLRTTSTLLLAALASGCVELPSGARSGTVTAPHAAAAAGAAAGTTAEPAGLRGITAAHNRVRADVGVPPLRWNPALAETARRWANACVDVEAPRGMIDHSSGIDESIPGPIGENLYATTAPAADPVAAVNGWAAEVVHYDRERNACSGGECGHYTQVIWSTTRELGCGVGSCPRLRFRTTLVCHYSPAGNVVGRRPY